jgi:hypothetical protein
MMTRIFHSSTVVAIVLIASVRFVPLRADEAWAEILHVQFGVPESTTLVQYYHSQDVSGGSSRRDPIIVYSDGREVAWVFDLGQVGGIGVDLGDPTYQKLCTSAGERHGAHGCVEALRMELLKQVRLLRSKGIFIAKN